MLLRFALRLLMALAAMLACSAQAEADTWYKAATPDFVIYSEGDPAELAAFAENLERFDAMLRQRFAVPPDTSAHPLSVYLLDKAKSVSRLLDRDHIAGFYSPSSEGSFAIATRTADKGGKHLSGQETLFHEYVHHFMYRHLAAPWPAWYREGLAEYLSTVTFAPDGTWVMGAPAQYRLRRAKDNRVPLAQFLSGSAANAAKGDPRDFYAQAWLLAHMLESDPALAARLNAYLAAIAAGKDPEEAAMLLGDPAKLDETLQAYARKPLPVWHSPEPIAAPTVAAAPVVTMLDAAQSELLELSLARRTGREPLETRAALADLAASHPDDPGVLYQLALADRDTAQAEAETDRLLAIAPDHARGHVLKAELLATHNGDWQTILAHLAAANRLAPDDPYVAVTGYRVAMQLGVRPSPEMFASIAHAFALAPESNEVRLAHAFSLAARRRFDEAEKVARVMAYDPHGGEVGRKAIATIEQMRSLFSDAP